MEQNNNREHRYQRFGIMGLAAGISLALLYWFSRYGATLFVVLLPFFMAIIIAYILDPLVDFFERRRLPRRIGILLIYAIFFSLFFLLGVSTIPRLVTELQKLGERLPDYTAQFQSFILSLQSDYQRFNLPESVRVALDQNIVQMQENIQEFVERITSVVVGFFSHLFTILIIPLLVYYILRDIDSLKRSVVLLFPKKHRKWITSVGSEMDHTMGAYFRGTIVICFLVGVMSYVSLLLLGVDFALILGIIAGITNIIPYFGPLIGAVPAVIIALLASPALALKVVIVLVIVQQVESQFIAPQILGRSLGLHPLVVIFVLIIGGRLFGMLGLIFAVPFTALVRIFIKHAVDLAVNR